MTDRHNGLRLRGAKLIERQTATLARLQRVNRALAKWDEYEADRELPAELRRNLPAPAGLTREDLLGLRAVIMGLLLDIEANAEWRAWAWERRN